MPVKNRGAELIERWTSGPPLVTDGGTGAMLRKLGWEGPAARACLDAPEVVSEIHRSFVSAGAELILTNTFALAPGADSAPLVEAAVRLAREAAEGRAFVAGSIAGTDPLNAIPLGRALISAGVDAIMVETIVAREAEMAFALAVKFEHHLAFTRGCPLMVSFAPDPAPLALIAERSGALLAAPAGANCGTPAEVLALGARFARRTPLVLRPNAGIPTGSGRSLEWPETPESFHRFAKEAQALGARIIGGCCGATPAHIAAIARAVRY